VIRFLLDTNICIETIRGKSAPVLAHLRKCDPASVGISSVTLAELRYGVSRSSDPARNLAALARFCAPLEIIPFDEPAAAGYGNLRHALQTAGTPIGPLDMLIAAHAISLGAILVTNNQREFRRVRGLMLENWVRP
jgi:tRNA(fMet)-specific endonuclease VapC